MSENTSSTIKSRKEYLNGTVSLSEYYSQFLDTDLASRIVSAIGESKILKSEDPHFNDIPLRKWDALLPLVQYSNAPTLLKEAGDYLTLSGAVCIAKEAARQFKARSQVIA